MDVAYQLGFCLPQSPQSRQKAHSEPVEEPVVQPVEQENLEDPQVCGELGTEVAGGLETFFLPCWEETELPANAPGCGRTQALGLPAPCHFGHHDTFSAKATFFRLTAGPATRTHGQVPVYTPELGGAL